VESLVRLLMMQAETYMYVYQQILGVNLPEQLVGNKDKYSIIG